MESQISAGVAGAAGASLSDQAPKSSVPQCLNPLDPLNRFREVISD